ncbi:Acyl-CoA thioesterase II [hydrothermal vent metagenome]|uniref:Acyl-CoA thioesterase II n=1 Tax=hydrothermal vent metagenome TaxID=652676 RepID=A0A3B0RPM8_9ZZZZ
MATELENLLETLDLEKLEENLFRGSSPQVGWQRVFGGQVIGQALVAATRTVEEGRTAHSLHGYFIRPGDPSIPIVYDVDRYRDGKSFTTRRVVAIQHGQPIFSMAASFHLAEEGFDHQHDMPDVPMPEDLPSEKQLLEKFQELMPDNMKHYFTRQRPIELRPTEPERYLNPKKDASAIQNVWIRATQVLPDDPALHQCVLAYASDMTLLDTSLVPHGRNLFDPDLMMASLDHALWFHRPFKADEWLLYAQDSPSSSGALGFNRGSIFTQEGALVASVTQEGLIRRKRKE